MGYAFALPTLSFAGFYRDSASGRHLWTLGGRGQKQREVGVLLSRVLLKGTQLQSDVPSRPFSWSLNSRSLF